MYATLRWFTALCLFFCTLQVQASQELFNVKVALVEPQESETRQQQYDSALAEAARVELIRLTGRLDINEQEEVKGFLTNPRSWLTSYRYLPVKQEGVVVGTEIEFVFDQKRIYQYFQQQNLIIWPSERRPKTLVMGTQQLAGTSVKLDQQRLDFLPTLDFKSSAERLGVPVIVPDNTEMWVTATKVENDKKIAYIISEAQASYLMTFEIINEENGDNQFYWKLYDQTGNLIRDGQASNRLASVNLDNVFANLLSFYSQPYRDQADILGAVTLSVSGLKSVENLTEIEAELARQKPLIHQAKLASIKNNEAVFDVVYQGQYSHLLSRLQQFGNLKLTSENAIISVIKTVWQDDEQKPKVIDFGTYSDPESDQIE